MKKHYLLLKYNYLVDRGSSNFSDGTSENKLCWIFVRLIGGQLQHRNVLSVLLCRLGNGISFVERFCLFFLFVKSRTRVLIIYLII